MIKQSHVIQREKSQYFTNNVAIGLWETIAKTYSQAQGTSTSDGSSYGSTVMTDAKRLIQAHSES